MVKIKVNVSGMACNMCEARMDGAVKDAFDVKEVRSSHKDSETVVIAESEIPEAEMKRVVEETGFEYKGMTTEPYEKKFSLFGRH